MGKIQISGFPTRRGRVFRWAPILFQPIHFSPERLIVGIAIADKDSAFVLRANRLDKLKCLFGNSASDAIFAAEVALESLERQAMERGFDALSEYAVPVSGISIGEARNAEGEHWREVAERWFSASSAMFERHHTMVQLAQEAEREVLAAPAVLEGPRERLPALVAQYVIDQRPSLKGSFSPRFFGGREIRRPAEPRIDFKGMRLNANFGTLFANRLNSVDRIKRRMWDLKILKERERAALFDQRFEMIIQHPSKNDPQISDRQQKNLRDSIFLLEGEADTVEIRLRPLTTVREIGELLLEAEAA